MKSKYRTFIRKKALEIIELEQKIQFIMSTLQPEDVFLIDEYIMRNIK